MDISVSTGLYYTKNYKQILDAIAATSCKNIELFLNQSFIDVPISELEKEVAKRNLNILSIHTPLEFIAFPRHESEDFWIDKCLHYAQLFNSKVIVSHMVYGEYFIKTPHSLDEIHKENIIKYKDNKNIYITTENLPHFSEGSFLGEKYELLDFIKDNEAFITFDTTHCAYSNLSILETYMDFNKHVKNIHISDFKDQKEHKILGTGDLPLKEFLHMLQATNYDGILTIELDFDNKQRNNVDNLNQASKEIEKSIQFINSSITVKC